MFCFTSVIKKYNITLQIFIYYAHVYETHAWKACHDSSPCMVKRHVIQIITLVVLSNIRVYHLLNSFDTR